MIYKRPDHKLSENQVRLFLLKRLREAKRRLREAKRRNASDFDTVNWYRATELEANNCYRIFCENLDNNYLMAALDTKQSWKVAKTLYGDYR